MSVSSVVVAYIGQYPPALVEQVRQRIEDGSLGRVLRRCYPKCHEVRNERRLQEYVGELKSRYLRSAPPLSKVIYDNHIHVINNALGLHTTVSRVQGAKLKSKREIRIATLFRDMPEEFLRMIVVHELAHLKVSAHDKAFYQLCCHMEPDYHQYEFDLRACLCWLDSGGESPWQVLSDD